MNDTNKTTDGITIDRELGVAYLDLGPFADPATLEDAVQAWLEALRTKEREAERRDTLALLSAFPGEPTDAKRYFLALAAEQIEDGAHVGLAERQLREPPFPGEVDHG